jgi:acetyl/propionyl-CoA carboxylase alpha subunit
MGIKCISVYVDADKNEPFVHMSDQSIRLNDGGYLDSKEIIKAAKNLVLKQFIQDMVFYLRMPLLQEE